MKRKINVFYVWGYNGSPESSTVSNLKQLLGKEYNVISDYYAQYNPKEAITDINYYIKKHNIDTLFPVPSLFLEQMCQERAGRIAIKLPPLRTSHVLSCP